jgi:hypothetical protein
MKQISEVEEKPFTSSLNICPEASFVNRVGAGVTPTPPYPCNAPPFPSGSVDISLKDDVNVLLLLLGVSFTVFSRELPL